LLACDFRQMMAPRVAAACIPVGVREVPLQVAVAVVAIQVITAEAVIPVVMQVVMQGGRAATFGGLALLAALLVDIPAARGAVAVAVALVIGVAVHRLSAMEIAVVLMQL
jgi:hypothetical protein